MVIKENEKDKEQRLIDKEKERLHAIKLQELYVQEQDRKDQQRADEWAARENRIQQAMNKMADTVIKKSNEAEKNFEKQLLRQAEERDNRAEKDEKRRKDKARQRDIDIKKILDQQLREKQDLKNKEMI